MKDQHQYWTDEEAAVVGEVNGEIVSLSRTIAERKLGRKLLTWEHVIHINGDWLDNRRENLEVVVEQYIQ